MHAEPVVSGRIDETGGHSDRSLVGPDLDVRGDLDGYVRPPVPGGTFDVVGPTVAGDDHRRSPDRPGSPTATVTESGLSTSESTAGGE